MTVAENLAEVRRQIAAACERVGREPRDVTLVAVSKTHPAAAVERALAAGQRDFGENYVQEAREKVPLVAGGPCWHYIGRLQRNKVKYLAPWVHLIHTVDSLKLAAEIDKQAAQHRRTIPILLQVNVAGEDAKSGCRPEDAGALAREMLRFPALELRGLMTMPPFWPAERVRPFFRQLRELRDRLCDELGRPLPELSMGMSDDFPAAVEEGATLVRVGTAIFGARPTAGPALDGD